MRRAAAAALMLAALGSTANAQYLFQYAVWGSYTRYTDGAPFGDLLCTGTTAVINYDADPLTNNPKISTDLCPLVVNGENFGAQFWTYVYAPFDANYTFWVGSDDGSGLYVDGQKVITLVGEQPFHSTQVTIPFLAGTTHSWWLNYYANDYGGSAVQATIDSRLDVAIDPTVFPVTTPDVPPGFLVGTGFGVFAAAGAVRRRLRRRVET